MFTLNQGLQFIVSAVIFLLLGVYSTHVDIGDSVFDSNRVAKIEKIANGQPCTDAAGNVYSEGQSFSDNGTCVEKTCVEAVSGNYFVVHECREILDSENPDHDNCEIVSDNSYAFPHCCPVLVCPDGVVITTTPGPDCYDRASNFSCQVWKEFNGCDPGSEYYNFTYIYCGSTCLFC